MAGNLVTRRALLGLEPMGEFYQTVAQVPFAITGLAVWGSQPGDSIEHMQIGHLSLASSAGWTPACFYSMPAEFGYAALAKALEVGGMGPQSWGPEGFLQPGTMFRLRTRRRGNPVPNLQIAVWGYQLVAFSEMTITSLPDLSYFELLATERKFHAARLVEIDETLARVAKPQTDKPETIKEPE